MKKKFLLVMLVTVMLVPSFLFAKAFSFSLGGVAMYNVLAGMSPMITRRWERSRITISVWIFA